MIAGASFIRHAVLLAGFLLGAAVLAVPRAEAQSQAAPPTKSAAVPWGFRDVYGIKLNILEETGEIEAISLVAHTRSGYGGLLEFEYSLSRRFSIEAEFPWAFSRPAFSGFDLEGTYAVVRDDARQLMVLAGSEFFIPTRTKGEVEIEPYFGFLKSFSSVAILAKLSLALEGKEDSEPNVMDELQPSLAIGPYFRLNDRIFLGIPVAVGGDAGRLAFKSGFDLNLRVTDALRIFFIAQAKFSRTTDLSFSLGCFLEID